MERYRSGHNGPDSKSGVRQRTVGSNPTRSALQPLDFQGVFAFKTHIIPQPYRNQVLMVRYEEVLSIMMAPMVLTMDTHAPNYLRVNVICQMMPEYAETYGVVEGDGMYVKPEDRLVVWGK